jgi:hypothetical protein
LEPHRVIFVQVAGFTFEFHNTEQVQACLEYFNRKLHPSSRIPLIVEHSFSHWEAQRWFERLPLYLREESKRVKVVEALTEAIWQIQAGILK